MRIIEAIIRPHLIRGQKKQRRRRMGLIKPHLCPNCGHYTRQAPISATHRKCLPCGHEWEWVKGANPVPLPTPPPKTQSLLARALAKLRGE